ncbi:MAG: hypothetical protein OXU36_11520 [Candidatus Poribacteria bacterium]|nr:hypothetical protein [Candidatus Poribacteria bacterium]
MRAFTHSHMIEGMRACIHAYTHAHIHEGTHENVSILNAPQRNKALRETDMWEKYISDWGSIGSGNYFRDPEKDFSLSNVLRYSEPIR